MDSVLREHERALAQLGYKIVRDVNYRHGRDHYPIPWDVVEGIKLEIELEYDKWARQIPQLEFPAGWKVQIIPPSGRATVRFRVNEKVSVYLDCHGALGAMRWPYWEAYAWESEDPERFSMDDTQGLLDYIQSKL